MNDVSMPETLGEDDMEWTDEKVEQLKAAWAAGRTQVDIAVEFGTTPATISGKVRRLKLPLRTDDERRAAISNGVRAYNARWPGKKKVSLANPQEQQSKERSSADQSAADLLDMLRDQPNQGPTAILSLHWTDCKWPIGDIMTDPDNFRFCRQPRVALPSQGRGGGERMMSYCAEHCRMAYGTRR
jgi:hypothetical protein